VRRNGITYHGFCFDDPAHAGRFSEAIGGKPFDRRGSARVLRRKS
jgi:hypothetical protein